MTKWFCHVACFANAFLLLFLFSVKHDIFILKKEKKLIFNIHQVRCYLFFIVEIIVESVNLIKMAVQNLKLYNMMENN